MKRYTALKIIHILPASVKAKLCLGNRINKLEPNVHGHANKIFRSNVRGEQLYIVQISSEFILFLVSNYHDCDTEHTGTA